MRAFLYPIFLCFIFNLTLAQDNQFKEPIPRTPNAASLGKYGDIPVSYHTGVPNISIPIYTVEEGDLSLPISISYHSSGVKVEEVASWVGLGWSLNAGGVISRTIMGGRDEGLTTVVNDYSSKAGWGWFKNYGAPDEITNPYIGDPTYGSPNQTMRSGYSDPAYVNRSYFLDAANGLLDAEPDLFTFNFQGYSGKFFFDDTRKVYTIPWEDVYIKPLNDQLSAWLVVSPDGTKYYFGGTAATEKNYTSVGGLVSYADQYNSSTSWYLYRIESVNGKHWIQISYTSEDYSFCDRPSHSVILRDDYGGPVSGSVTIAPTPLIVNTVKGKRITKIETSSGTVMIDFIASHTRQDLNAYGNQNATNTQAKGLTSIKITGANGLCKEFDLNLNYFQSSTSSSYPSNYTSSVDTKRLKLISIQEKSCDGTVTKNPHVFTYNGTQMARRYSLARDHWGYYNGSDGNTGLIPNGIVVPGRADVNGGATRSVLQSRAMAWILTGIQYPTKGSTSFEYEVHKDINNEDIGGLRVKTITNSSNDGSPDIIRTFTYESPQLFTVNPNNSLTDFYRQHPHDNQKLARENPLPGNVFGYIIRSTPPVPQYTTQGYHIGYRTVYENYANGAKTKYVYNDISASHSFGYPEIPSHSPVGKGQIVWNNQIDNLNNEIHTVYNQHNNGNFWKELTLSRVGSAHDFSGNTTSWGGDFAAVKTYYLRTVRTQLTQKVETIDGISTTTTYSFDPNNKHGNPIKITATNSKGQTVETNIVYPSDAGSGAPVQMHDPNNTKYKNMLGVAIDQKTKVNEVETSRSHNYYAYNSPDDMIHLTSTRVYPTGGTEYKDIFFNYDKHDKLASVERQDDITTSFLWGYNNSLPIAKVQNATLVKIDQTISTTKTNDINKSTSGTISGVAGDFTIESDQDVDVKYTYNCSFNSCYTGGGYHYADIEIKNENGQTISNSSVHLWQAGTITKSHSLTAGTYYFHYTAALNRPPACNSNIPYYLSVPIVTHYTYQEKESNIVYESFEEDATASTAYAKTGKKSKYGAYTMQISTEPGTYILSYWKKSNSTSLWQYYEVELTNPTSYTLSSSGQYVDEIRFYPKGAQMQTFTHEPGFGATSETDINGKTVTYEYDKLGRLKTARDNDGNILNHTTYKYQQ
jgi:YD repeat-containing protein